MMLAHGCDKRNVSYHTLWRDCNITRYAALVNSLWPKKSGRCDAATVNARAAAGGGRRAAGGIR